MAYRVFEIPDFEEFVDVLGTGPEPVEGDALRLNFTRLGEQLVITLDTSGRSAHIRWTRGEALVVDVYREGAVAVRLTPSGPISLLTVVLDTDDQHGELQVQTNPTFELKDWLLFR
jgi:hypothetical protein